MSSEMSTWQKTKDALLAGLLGLISILALKILADVAELKKDIAVYQANYAALKEDHDRLRSEVATHFSEDRERFRSIDVRRR